MTRDSSGSKLLVILIALAVLLSGQLVLSGCEVDRETQPDGDRAIEFRIDEEAVEDVRDDVDEAGERLGEAAESAGETIEEAANDAAEAIDENVDLGDNAGTPEPDASN